MSATVTTPSGLVYWLPLDEAARRFHVDRDELVAAARQGQLDVRAKVAGGDVVASVCSTELTARYGPPRSTPAPRPVRESVDDEPGRLVAAEDRARVLELDGARLAGRLEVAERVERGLQRYVDRIEDRRELEREAYERKLADAELVRLQLARVVGRLETEVARLQAAADVDGSPALPGAALPGAALPGAALPGAARKSRARGWRRWIGGAGRSRPSRGRD